jgi:hydroxypyruvate isomerase
MPRFAANVSMLFTEYAFLDRFDAAAQAGFGAVELQFPYAVSIAAIGQRLLASGLPLVLHNLPAGDWASGERGIACHPGRVAEFRAGVALAIDYANALGVRQLNCLAGIAPPGVTDAHVRGTLVDNLAFAAEALHTHGIRLLLEPINTLDIPGFYVNRTAQALAILEAVGAPNAFVQYDLYHAQCMEGDLMATLQRCLPRIGHIQLADHPGRHEPGTGDIDYRLVLGWLDHAGYAGYVGCEYIPQGAGPNPTQAGLGWLAAHGQTLPGRAV